MFLDIVQSRFCLIICPGMVLLVMGGGGRGRWCWRG